MQHVFWQKHRATWIAASVPCAPLSGRYKTRNGECIMPTASCIPPSAWRRCTKRLATLLHLC